MILSATKATRVPAAFRAVNQYQRDPGHPLERYARRAAARALSEQQVIPAMIDRIKTLFEANTEGASVQPQEAP
jgi:CRISPR-associated protein Cas1